MHDPDATPDSDPEPETLRYAPKESGIYPASGTADEETGPSTLRFGALEVACARALAASSATGAGRAAPIPDWMDPRAVVTSATQGRAGDPPTAAARWRRASARMELGERGGGARDCAHAIAEAPDRADAYVLRAEAHLALGDATQAVADCSRAIALAPAASEAFTIRGKARATLGDHAGAAADLGIAIGMSPSDPELFVLRGDERAAAGDLQGAIADYGVAILLDPTDPAPLLKRGSLRFARDPEGARADWERAASIQGPLDSMERIQAIARRIG